MQRRNCETLCSSKTAHLHTVRETVRLAQYRKRRSSSLHICGCLTVQILTQLRLQNVRTGARACVQYTHRRHKPVEATSHWHVVAIGYRRHHRRRRSRTIIPQPAGSCRRPAQSSPTSVSIISPTARPIIPANNCRSTNISGRCITRLEVIAIRQPSIFFSVCLPSTSENISFSPVFSRHCALITLRPRGLRNSFAILATLKIFDWHWRERDCERACPRDAFSTRDATLNQLLSLSKPRPYATSSSQSHWRPTKKHAVVSILAKPHFNKAR